MHETGHMFSIQHCTKYECLISGSNHLGESDRRPLDMCPEDALKIAWGFDYEPAKRYRALAAFWKRESRADLADEFEAKAKAVTDAAK
jgi:archaemetzincin